MESYLHLWYPALFLDKKIGDYQEGLLDNQMPVFVKTSKNLAGEIKWVKVKKVKEEKLLGSTDPP